MENGSWTSQSTLSWYLTYRLVDVCFMFLAYAFGWIAFMHNTCYVFTYIYAIMLWLEFSPFCCYDAWMASCRLVAWMLFGRGSSSVSRSVALIRSTGSREIVFGHLCLWHVVLDLLMYLLCFINTHFGKQFSCRYSAFIPQLKTPLCWMDLFVNIFPFVLRIALWAGVVCFVYVVWHALFWHRWWPFFLTLMFLWIVYSELCHLSVNSYGVKRGVLQVVSEQVDLSGQVVVLLSL